MRFTQRPRRIAVFQALFLGDLLCAVPALNALKRQFADAEITLIGLAWAREMAERLPAIDSFIEFGGYPGLPETPYDPSRTAEFIDQVRQIRFDIAIQLHGSGRYANELVSRFGATTTVGFAGSGDMELSVTLPWMKDEPEVERWLRLIAPLGADSGCTQIELPIGQEEHRAAANLLNHTHSFGPLVGIHCGSKLVSRRWPIQQFASLCRALWVRCDAQLVLTGNAAERHLADQLRTTVQAPTLDLVARTDLGTFFAVISQLDLLVTNDTAASHVAAATGTPSVVLFGPSRPSRWAPLNHRLHVAIDARTFIECPTSPDQVLRRLPVEPVLAACARMLDSRYRPGEGVPVQRAAVAGVNA